MVSQIRDSTLEILWKATDSFLEFMVCIEASDQNCAKLADQRGFAVAEQPPLRSGYAGSVTTLPFAISEKNLSEINSLHSWELSSLFVRNSFLPSAATCPISQDDNIPLSTITKRH